MRMPVGYSMQWATTVVLTTPGRRKLGYGPVPFNGGLDPQSRRKSRRVYSKGGSKGSEYQLRRICALSRVYRPSDDGACLALDYGRGHLTHTEPVAKVVFDLLGYQDVALESASQGLDAGSYVDNVSHYGELEQLVASNEPRDDDPT